jgi:hypothetical protein
MPENMPGPFNLTEDNEENEAKKSSLALTDALVIELPRNEICHA